MSKLEPISRIAPRDDKGATGLAAAPAKSETGKPEARKPEARKPDPAKPAPGSSPGSKPKKVEGRTAEKARSEGEARALEALLAPERSRLKRRSYLPALAGFAAMVLLPTALAAAYWWGVAADRYVSEFRYSVRGGATMSESGEGGLMHGSGALVFASDSFILEDYLASLQAPADIERALPLREMLGRDGGDPVRGYDPAMPAEDLLSYWTTAVQPRFDAITGITTVEVSMFRPEDAQAVGLALVAELDRIVDALSAKARGEMLAYVNDQHALSAERLTESRAEIEAFRRTNQVVSPQEEATIGAGIIGEIQNQLTTARVELRALRERAPGNPRIPSLENDIRALEAELLSELERRGGEAEGRRGELPAQLSGFEELQSNYEIARDTFVNTLTLKQQAEAFATLGQAELVVFVPPREPMMSTRPLRWLETAKVFGVAFALWLVLRVFMASLKA